MRELEKSITGLTMSSSSSIANRMQSRTSHHFVVVTSRL